LSAGETLAFTAVTLAANDRGELDANARLPDAIPTARPTTLRLVNAMPPKSVSVNGKPITFARYPLSAAEGYMRPSWHYDGDEMTVVINTATQATNGACNIVVEGASWPSEAAGLKGKMRHAFLAKANMDEARETPGEESPYPGGSMIAIAASTANALSYLAGKAPLDEFFAVLANFTNVYAEATAEVHKMLVAETKHPNLERLNYSFTMLAGA
jgi:hypothetical protein